VIPSGSRKYVKGREPDLFTFKGSVFTTGLGRFAECLKHSANPEKHSAKSMPSVALGKDGSANCASVKASLPSTFYRALSKDFAECQTVLGKEKLSSRRWGDGDSVFTECPR
jgi:hypothetical protein